MGIREKVKTVPPGEGNAYTMPIIDPSGIARKFLDVSYTPDLPHPMRKLDLYLPERGEGPFPVLIYMHGGGFVDGRKNDFHVLSYMEALDEGFAFVSVEQRLCTAKPDGSYDREGIFPGPLFDLKAAIRFLRANAGRYQLDPGRFALLGTSAGGYHAVMAAATMNVEAMYDASLGWGETDGSVQAVVDLFGVGDLTLQSAFSGERLRDRPEGATGIAAANFADVFLDVPVGQHPNLAFFANPETWVRPEMPPVLLQAGTADEMVPVACSRNLAGRINAVCGQGRAVLDEFPGYGHGDPGFHKPENHRRIWDWLKERLG